MEEILKLYKEQGETPLECIQRFKAAHPQYASVPMTYAGRLDPMASGLLLVLAGEKCKEKDSYLGLDKEYMTEVLLGVETDTSDALGIIKHTTKTKITLSETDIAAVLKQRIGKFMQSYPLFSSRTIDGTPMFELAKAGIIDDTTEDIPDKEVEIFSIDIVDIAQIHKLELLKRIEDGISKVKGDFRQDEIVAKWKELICEELGYNPDFEFMLVKLRVKCSSGVYIRSLAQWLGRQLGSGALALSIERTKVGSFSL